VRACGWAGGRAPARPPTHVPQSPPARTRGHPHARTHARPPRCPHAHTHAHARTHAWTHGRTMQAGRPASRPAGMQAGRPTGWGGSQKSSHAKKNFGVLLERVRFFFCTITFAYVRPGHPGVFFLGRRALLGPFCPFLAVLGGLRGGHRSIRVTRVCYRGVSYTSSTSFRILFLFIRYSFPLSSDLRTGLSQLDHAGPRTHNNGEVYT
jgi:hypothetical protein